jgi:hypothetical protein
LSDFPEVRAAIGLEELPRLYALLLVAQTRFSFYQTAFHKAALRK